MQQQFPDVWLPSGWQPVGDFAASFELELRRELGSRHVLFGCDARAIAVRMDSDDVLFAIERVGSLFAIVHLTWRGSEEPDHLWPATRLLRNLEELHKH